MPVRLWLVALLLTLMPAVATAAAGPPSPASVERAANELSEHLVSPCCYRESLRSHNSPLADELRREIRKRLAAGEAPAAIEDDLVARYGPEVRAFSHEWDPRHTAAIVVLAAIVGGLALLVRGVRRSRRAPVATAPLAPTDRRLEDALDDELLDCDG